jgi:hypothetical protein
VTGLTLTAATLDEEGYSWLNFKHFHNQAARKDVDKIYFHELQLKYFVEIPLLTDGLSE